MRGLPTGVCAALAALSLASSAAAAGPLRLDLRTGSLSGQAVLGRQLGPVLAALSAAGLGRPTARIRLGGEEVALRFGPERGFRALVLFRPIGASVVATSIALEDPQVTDPRVGPLLADRPKSVVERILRTYPGSLRREACVPACPLQLLTADGGLRIALGASGGVRFVRVELARARA